jgi:pimeloyl-ACP methyl ester carboxylesterase
MWRSRPAISPEAAQPGQARQAWFAPKGQLRVGPLAVRTLGQGPPTLLLHGMLGSNRYWGGAFDQLAESGLLLAPDLLGFGASPRPLSGYGPEEHGRALTSSLAKLEVSERVLVVGHSLGALLALWMACNLPDRVRGVVAFAAPLFRDTEDARRRIAQLGRLERVFGLEGRLAKMACQNLCGKRPRLAVRLFSMIRPDLPHPLLEDATRHSWVSYSETMRRVIVAAEGANWLASARAPILLVAGTHDRYLDLGFQRELADRHPHVSLRLWPGEGHDLPRTQPEQCLSAIEGWNARKLPSA